MTPASERREFDVIVVGTGPGGASVARALCQRKLRVLILEAGSRAPLKDTFSGFAAVHDSVPVGDGVRMPRGITSGGTSSIYFAVAEMPPLQSFLSLGIDLSDALREAKEELPLGVLPDGLIGAQAIKVRDSANELGYDWVKRTMMIDQSKCRSGYAYDAKWTSRSYVEEAVRLGAELVTDGQVIKILRNERRSIGVEYVLNTRRTKSETRQAFASKVILSAGALATPLILRRSGIGNVVSRGFYCHPSIAVFGTVPGLKGKDNFVACMGAELADDIALGDANAPRTLYRLIMLGHRRYRSLFLYRRTIGVAVVVKDKLGGKLLDDGTYHKPLSAEDCEKLGVGEQAAMSIVKRAGARDIFKSSLVAAHFGGVLKILEDTDEELQTELQDLHVCDGSLIPEDFRLPPTLTLVCLGKYLAARLTE